MVKQWAGDASYNVHILGEGGGLDWDRLREESYARLAEQPEVFVGGLRESERSEGTGLDRCHRSVEEAARLAAIGKRRVATIKGGSRRVSHDLPKDEVT